MPGVLENEAARIGKHHDLVAPTWIERVGLCGHGEVHEPVAIEVTGCVGGHPMTDHERAEQTIGAVDRCVFPYVNGLELGIESNQLELVVAVEIDGGDLGGR